MKPDYRNCDCPHGFPLCACAEGGAIGLKALLLRSRMLSSIAGWPARVKPEIAAELVAQRRARKPRVPLGTRPLAPADCGPCREKRSG